MIFVQGFPVYDSHLLLTKLTIAPIIPFALDCSNFLLPSNRESVSPRPCASMESGRYKVSKTIFEKIPEVHLQILAEASWNDRNSRNHFDFIAHEDGQAVRKCYSNTI